MAAAGANYRNDSVWCRAMGIYLFERSTEAGAGRDAGASLWGDISLALREIDWVDSFSLRADGREDGLLAVDILFESEWPDIRTGNPDQVGEVFHRLGLRTIANPTQSRDQVSADDPLGVAGPVDEDLESLLEFDLDDEDAA